MTDMVEKVARAIDPGAWYIRDEYLERADEWAGKGLASTSALRALRGLVSGYRTGAQKMVSDSLAKARDAIEAMREPTPAMEAAGDENFNLGYETCAAMTWHSMIDAALAPLTRAGGEE